MEYIFLPLALILVVLGILAWKLEKKQGSAWKEALASKEAYLTSRLSDTEFHARKSLLIDADALLDAVLKHVVSSGTTMGERLKNAKHVFPAQHYQDIWDAHKLRNRLVHEVDAHVSGAHLEQAIKILLQAVRSKTTS